MLDVETGAPLKSRWVKSEVKADFLVGNGEKMHLRDVGLDMMTLDEKGGNSRFLTAAYGGFLDDSWFNVSYWRLSDVSGSMLATDSSCAFGVDVYGRYGWKSDAKPKFYPGRNGCILFASAERMVKTKSGESKLRQTRIWSVPLPILAKALVVAGDKVCAAGVRDLVDAKEPWAHLHGERGAKLLIFAKTTGETQAEFDLMSPPVYDGMASAHGGLFISCQDGSVVCFGE
jgi:hypothetical protein